jgi:hypothetical protein
MIDIKHKKCEKCESSVLYGIPGNSPIRCTKHKEEGMIVKPTSRCKIKNCNEIALYALNNKQAIHCETHKEDGEINIIEKNCKSCNLPNILNKNNECTYCDPKHFNQFRLGKQLRVKRFLDKNGFKYKSYDKAVNYIECGDRYRPDFTLETENELCDIILEADENKHNGNPEECECIRMVNIAQSNGRPTLFIRYNPDSYKVKNIKKDPAHSSRMKVLKLVLESTLNIKPEEMIGYCMIKQLYYDDFDETNIKWEIITPFEEIDELIPKIQNLDIINFIK